MSAANRRNRSVKEERQVSVTIEKESPRQPGVLRLLEQSDAYAQSLYPAESNHLVDVSTLEKPSVAFFVARHEGAIVGCCALVDAGDGTAEIKRMFVDPKARGLKIGRRLLEHVESHGHDAGLSAIRLETGIYQPEAIGLYKSAGYAEIGPFGAYLADPLSLFMEKKIG
ncbi:GCN5 family acetyltransferase [Pararhizobium polonicum]|uniref:GCN5 family acetyltransferase n=1 Tax=Pararhizobium polonicum TaxID=1612624 RepID=A0A1C7P640_9HYPH|nr:GNAT family N-acetyltransferase [Pararhizobium polonicum]OBZ96416.1 GCN5 family acetyltransferase [Pararhizobium polonicum]